MTTTPALRDYTALVHKTRSEESFVRGAESLAPDLHRIIFEVPTVHPYFGDGVAGGAVEDDLFLQEVARQACTLAVHCFHDLPMDHAFLVRGWRYTPEGATTARGAARLVVEVRTSDGQRRGGHLTRLSSHAEIRDETLGQLVATLSTDATYLPAPRYQRLRDLGRETPAPRSNEVAPRTAARAEAGLVGRTDDANLVLGADIDSPELLSPLSHQTFFDHSLDHVPMMLVLEAARQHALRCGIGRVSQRHSYAVEFPGMLELDAPVLLRDVEQGPEGATIEFVQHDVVKALVTMSSLDALDRAGHV